MDTELMTLLRALSGDSGWLLALAAWMASARVALKPFSAMLQSKMTSALARVAESPETDDDTLVCRILSGRTYRAMAMLLDLVCSFKLPTLVDFNKLLETKP